MGRQDVIEWLKSLGQGIVTSEHNVSLHDLTEAALELENLDATQAEVKKLRDRLHDLEQTDPW